MRVAILQPGYLPWLGFFDLIIKSDKFIILDDVQYTVRDWRARNRIKTPQGTMWLTVPIQAANARDKLITDIVIDNSQHWQTHHQKSIRSFYKGAPFYAEITDLIQDIYSTQYRYLIDADMAFIRRACDYMNIGTPIQFSSNLKAGGNKDEKLLSLCKIAGATVYISGNAAKTYLRESIFFDEGIDVIWHDYQHPFYNQLWTNENGFISYLSVADLLFNHGKDSLAIISGDKIIPNQDNIGICNANDFSKV